MTTTFLAAVDGSEGSRRAAQFCAERARAEGARMLLTHVIHWSRYDVLTPDELGKRHAEKERELAEAHASVLDPLAEELRVGPSGEPDLEVQCVAVHGQPVDALIRIAQESNVTQLFSGRRGQTKLTALLFGSVAGGLVQACPVPLTVVP